LIAGTPLSLSLGPTRLLGAPSRTDAKVAIVPCVGYGADVKSSLKKGFDLVGGVGSLVKGKTVTVKINLTGTNFAPHLGRPAGESYMTHFDTAHALAALLFDNGAARVRFVESTNSRSTLENSLSLADWDVRALQSLGAVEFENTRNLGSGKRYAELAVAGSGYLFSRFSLNHSYQDTDVMVSLCKLKQHVATGVTLSMKNMFGVTPNSLYGQDAPGENAVGGRGPLHGSWGFWGSRKVDFPGWKNATQSNEAEYRVPHIVADICAARPIHLAIVDGITSMSGGEGPWCDRYDECRLTKPGVLVIGLNPVSTDAVGTALMGYENPRAPRGEGAFAFCDNHLLLAEKAGVGSADLAGIEVVGTSVEKAKTSYPPLRIAQEALSRRKGSR
jgi:uncharacterized protein (DUF362 family)